MPHIIDFHSHILPGIDDGSQNVEQSIAMLQAESAQGVSHVVLTPHFYAQQDDPKHFFHAREQAERTLRQAMATVSGLPTLSVGAEVYYFNGLWNVSCLPDFAIDGGKYILVELPMPPYPERIFQDLERIYEKRDLIPVIAHIDRYLAPFHTRKLLNRLSELPVILQANGDFFLDPLTRSMALRMLKKGQIRLLGSDCHNMTDRAPNLERALTVIRDHLGEDALSTVVQTGQTIFPDLK